MIFITKFRYFISEISLARVLSLLLSDKDRIGRGTKKIFSNKRTFFTLRFKIIIASSATRFAAFGAEKEEREKETRASSYLLHRERKGKDSLSLSVKKTPRAIHRLSKKRFEQNDFYLISSRLSVCWFVLLLRFFETTRAC